jgi:chromosome segregation and condensation protein ScpB
MLASIRFLLKDFTQAEEGKEEMIIGMHEDGLSNQQIAKISKKSEAEVAKIIENHKNR